MFYTAKEASFSHYDKSGPASSGPSQSSSSGDSFFDLDLPAWAKQTGSRTDKLIIPEQKMSQSELLEDGACPNPEVGASSEAGPSHTTSAAPEQQTDSNSFLTQ